MRLFDIEGYGEYVSIVRGGIDVMGPAKSTLALDRLKRGFGNLLNIASIHIATDSLQNVQGPRIFGERDPAVLLPTDSSGRSISKSIDTVAGVRFRFDLYVKPYEVDMYTERINYIESAFVDLNHAGSVIRRGIYGVDTFFQAGDEDRFLQPANRLLVLGAPPLGRCWGPAPPLEGMPGRGLLLAAPTNVTMPQGRPLPDGSGFRFYLQDALMREGVNNTLIKQVDVAARQGADSSALYEPHHVVVQLHPNGTANEPILDGADFPVQPIVYVADRHDRRIRLYDKAAYISARLDPVLWPDGSTNADGDLVELFGERVIELTYINDGRAFYTGLSVSVPVPQGLDIEFLFESDDPAFAALNVLPARSVMFVVEKTYRPPRVIEPRVPFSPIAIAAILVCVLGAMLLVSKYGLDIYRRRKQERHVVPAKEQMPALRDKRRGMAFAQDVSMKAHVRELSNGYKGFSQLQVSKVASPASVRVDAAGRIDAAELCGLPHATSGFVRATKEIGAAVAAGEVVSTAEALSSLGNEDQARAFEMLQAAFGKPIPVTALPKHMQILHEAGKLGMPNVMSDEEAMQQLSFEARRRQEAIRQAATSGRPKRKTWRASVVAGIQRLAGKDTSNHRPEEKEASAIKTATGLVEVGVIASPKPRAAQEYMRQAPARTAAERVHLASRKARRSISYAVASAGMHATAARLFPKEDSKAYLQGTSAEQELRIAMGAPRALETPPAVEGRDDGAGGDPTGQLMQAKPTVHMAPSDLAKAVGFIDQ